MGDVIDFVERQLIQKSKSRDPGDWFELFKALLRERMPTDDVHLVVAAVLDEECYGLSSPAIQRLANIYFEHMVDDNV